MKFKPDYLIIPTLLIKDSDISPAGGYVYGVIYLLSQLRSGKCTASNKTIGDITGISEGTVANMISVLNKKNYIYCEYSSKSHRQSIMPLIKYAKVNQSGSSNDEGGVHQTVKGGSSNSEQSNNKYNKTSINNIKEIFDFWQNQKIIQHHIFTNKMKRKIRSTLKEYSVREIKDAMKKYGKVINSDNYWFTYKWTITKFLSRGLTDFLDTPIEHYSKKKQEKNNFNKSKKQAYWQGNPVRERNGKKYVVSQDGDWLEFNGDETDIKYK